MNESPAPANPPSVSSQSTNPGLLTNRIVGDIGDDFDLGDGIEKPDTAVPSSIDVDDFDDDDSDPGEEDTKREKLPSKPKDEPAKPKPVPPPAARDDAEEPKTAKGVLPTDRGTEDKPYTVNDLPGDKFVKLKIDGKEQTLPMRELADGYIRKQTFDSSLSKAKQAAIDAERIAKSHIEERTKLRSDVDAFLGDDERMFKYLMERDPDVLLRLGNRIGLQYGEWQKDPTALQRHNWERQQRQLQAERQRVEMEKKQWAEERARVEATERQNQVWQPIWKEAIKEAGFPENTPKFQRTVKAMVKVAQDENGGKLTRELFIECVKEAARLAGAPTVDARKPPAQEPPVQRERAAAKPNGKDKWEGMSHAQRMRDPNYLLRK
jgi:hypothetical protein